MFKIYGNKLQYIATCLVVGISIIISTNSLGNESDSKSLGDSFLVDESLSLIIYNGPEFKLGETLDVGSDQVEVITGGEALVKGKKYEVNYKGYFSKIFKPTYKLYRTELPIVSVNTGDVEITDDFKIGANLLILENGKDNFNSDIGIKVRGGTSKRFSKKSFNIELWKNASSENSYKKKLLKLRKDDDWILDGLWNEPLRVRDYVSHSLWLKMGRYPYVNEKPEITFGIEKKFVELFLNGHYRGVYYLGEKIDRKQLGLKKYKDGELRGELYKGVDWKNGVLYKELDSYSNESDEWSGYEAKYPNEIGEIDWSNLHALMDFIINSDKATFDASIFEKIDLENMVDYYIFLNMVYAVDNRGKNLYTGRFNQDTPYFFVPWDMDGSFGNTWRGERADVTNKVLSNRLYDKLIKNDEFREEVKLRWTTLKTGVLSVVELQGMFTMNYDFLYSNGVYEREILDSELPQNYNDQEIKFIHDWIKRRFIFLDAYFSEL